MSTDQAYINGFVKRASEYGVSQDQAVELLKQAKKLDLDDIERHMGMYIRDSKDQDLVNRGIDEAYDKSFPLKHPYLTGIPTLGLAPAIAKDSAKDKIMHDLLRSNPEMHKEYLAAQEKAIQDAHRREVELMQKHIAEREAQARERMMLTGAWAARDIADRLGN